MSAPDKIYLREIEPANNSLVVCSTVKRVGDPEYRLVSECEWRQGRGFYNGQMTFKPTECGLKGIIIKLGDYCPYCGNKIKVIT